MPVREIDEASGEYLDAGATMGISTAPEDRGEEVPPEEAEEAEVVTAEEDPIEAAMARMRTELAALEAQKAAAAAAKPVEAPTKSAAEIEAEQVAAALAKANAAAEAEAKAAAQEKVVAERVAEATQRAAAEQAAMDAAKPNGAAQAPAAKPAGRQVAKPKAAEVARSAEEAQLAAMFEADAGRGLDFKAEDLAIPRLYLLQDMSPQVKERSPDFVPGARPGMWLNTVTGQILQQAVIITIKYQRRYVAWRPRLDNGGGGGLVRPEVPYEEFMGYEQTGISVRSYRDEKGLIEVVDTPELIALLLPEANSDYGPMPVAISFPKTKAKVVARMNTITTMQVGRRADGSEYAMPLYSNVFRLTQKVEGEGAQSYFVPVEEYLGRVSRADYAGRAKRLFEQFEHEEVVGVAADTASEQV